MLPFLQVKIKGVAMINEKDEKVDVSKRMLFKRAVAAVGVVATAGVAKTLTTAPTDSDKSKNRARYESEARQQERVMLQKRYVVMTDDEKKQMVNEILKNHYKELA